MTSAALMKPHGLLIFGKYSIFLSETTAHNTRAMDIYMDTPSIPWASVIFFLLSGHLVDHGVVTMSCAIPHGVGMLNWSLTFILCNPCCFQQVDSAEWVGLHVVVFHSLFEV